MRFTVVCELDMGKTKTSKSPLNCSLKTKHQFIETQRDSDSFAFKLRYQKKVFCTIQNISNAFVDKIMEFSTRVIVTMSSCTFSLSIVLPPVCMCVFEAKEIDLDPPFLQSLLSSKKTHFTMIVRHFHCVFCVVSTFGCPTTKLQARIPKYACIMQVS